MLVILCDLKFLIIEMLFESNIIWVSIQPSEASLYLDSLEIDQGINSYSGSLIVCFVCISAELCPKDVVSDEEQDRLRDSDLQDVVRTVNQV